jgi:predicted nuclease of predicted toxin-antitoxin system
LEAGSTLREYGFDPDTVWDRSLCGADDQTIADRVRGEGRILLTLDLDFANIRAYPPDQHPGIIVLRLKGLDKAYRDSPQRRLERIWRNFDTRRNSLRLPRYAVGLRPALFRQLSTLTPDESAVLKPGRGLMARDLRLNSRPTTRHGRPLVGRDKDGNLPHLSEIEGHG